MKNYTLKGFGFAVVVLSGLNFLAAGTTLASPQYSRVQVQVPRYTPPPMPRPQYTPPAPRPQYTPPTPRPAPQPASQYRSEPVPSEHTTVFRSTVNNPALRHAMTYNTRPGGVHINPEYFATHYGRAHGFHFTSYAGGPCIGDCGLRVFGGEWYFNCNGGWFGIIGQMPVNWAFQTDDLYIDIGDDGNYYLYDSQFPDAAVQLTFVQNIGDDQAGADQEQGDQSGQ
jgi:hypothetical protein